MLFPRRHIFNYLDSSLKQLKRIVRQSLTKGFEGEYFGVVSLDACFVEDIYSVYVVLCSAVSNV